MNAGYSARVGGSRMDDNKDDGAVRFKIQGGKQDGTVSSTISPCARTSRWPRGKLTSSCGQGSHSPKGLQTRSPVVACDSYRCFDTFGWVDEDKEEEADTTSADIGTGKSDRESDPSVTRL